MSLRTINVSQGSLAKVYEMALKLRADLHGKPEHAKDRQCERRRFRRGFQDGQPPWGEHCGDGGWSCHGI